MLFFVKSHIWFNGAFLKTEWIRKKSLGLLGGLNIQHWVSVKEPNNSPHGRGVLIHK